MKTHLEELRKKLLDLSSRNAAINIKFNKTIRFVDENLDFLYKKISEKFLIIDSLPACPAENPKDERSQEFQEKLNQELRNNESYNQASTEAAKQEVERKIRDGIRKRLGWKPHPHKYMSLEDFARSFNINPSYDLLHAYQDSKKSHSDNQIQTLIPFKEKKAKLNKYFNLYNSSINERGANTMFMTFGVLDWTESEGDKRVFSSPLLFAQVDIEKVPSNNVQQIGEYIYRIKSSGEDIQANQFLLKKLYEQFEITIPNIDDSFNDSDNKNPIQNYLNKIQNLTKNKPNWKVHYFTNVGQFLFQKLDLYNDLDLSKWDAGYIENHPVANLVFNKSPDTDNDKLKGDLEIYDTDSTENIKKVPHLIMNADSSQVSAIIDVMDGKNIIIKGPPGTGKSQTIANIIAMAMYNGQRVLFLSEKKAALDVVYKRLEESNLGPYCLAVHSQKTSGSDIIESLKERKSASKKTNAGGLNSQKTKYENARDELNKYSKFISLDTLGINKTNYQVLGKFLKFRTIIEEKNISKEFLDTKYIEIFKNKRLNIEKTEEQVDLLNKVEDIHLKLLSQLSSNDLANHPFRQLKDALATTLRGPTKRDKFKIEIEEFIKSLEEFQGDLLHFQAKYLADRKQNFCTLKEVQHLLQDYKNLRDAPVSQSQNIVLISTILNRKNKEAGLIQVSKLIDQINAIFYSPDKLLDPKKSDTIIDSDMLNKFLNQLDNANLINSEYRSKDANGDLESKKITCTNLERLENQILQEYNIHQNFTSLNANGLLELKALYQYLQEKITEPKNIFKEILEMFFFDLFSSKIFEDDFKNKVSNLKLDKNIKNKLIQIFLSKKGAKKKIEHVNRLINLFSNQNNILGEDLNTNLAINHKLLNLKGEVIEIISQYKNSNSLFTRFLLKSHDPFKLIKNLKRDSKKLEPELNTLLEKWDISFKKEIHFEHTLKDCKCIINDLPSYVGFLDYQERFLEKIEKDQTLKTFFEIYQKNNLPRKYLSITFQYLFYNYLWDTIMSWCETANNNSDFKSINYLFNGHLEVREEFQNSIDSIFQLSQNEINNKLYNASITKGNSIGGKKQWTDEAFIDNECAKNNRYSNFRKIMSQAGTATQELKPCFLMSPMSVARYLDQKEKFDLIVIDEASQMKFEDAFGAILRANQAVIVGDPKQLPPTNFFKTKDKEEDEDEEFSEEYGAESILDVFTNTFKERSLLYHYRSKHEHLIAFSNQEFYNNKLIVFPSVPNNATDSNKKGVFLHSVDGLYIDRENNVEADKCIELAKNIMIREMKKPEKSRLSLGIVCMNIKQADNIQIKLDICIEDSPECREYERSFQDHLEPLIIKNLENIQGDERDIIIISTTYGPAAPGQRVPQRFGPINGKHGWRRLNVLFTRAKEQIHIVSSLKPTDINASEPNLKSKKAFKDYISYAQDPKNIINTNPKKEEASTDSEFEDLVKAEIEKMGFEAIPQYGVGSYRIDLAVRDRHTGQILLGVECDGATYHSSKSARDRDYLRQVFLETKGWTIHRIWSTSWWQDEAGELKKLRDRLPNQATSPPDIVQQLMPSKDSENENDEEEEEEDSKNNFNKASEDFKHKFNKDEDTIF